MTSSAFPDHFEANPDAQRGVEVVERVKTAESASVSTYIPIVRDHVLTKWVATRTLPHSGSATKGYSAYDASFLAPVIH